MGTHHHAHDYEGEAADPIVSQPHHEHTHGAVDPVVFVTKRGVWAVKWSLLGLLLTALLQAGVYIFTGSVALLADTLHNAADAATALPLWIAFSLAWRRPSQRFTYGYGRIEDLAGLVVVLAIFFSACVALYQAITRLLAPQPVEHLWAVALAGIVGFIGNEAVAILRIRVGKEIGSAALEADGYHSRADGLTSLAVVGSAAGVALGANWADPLAGLLVSLMIFRIVLESGALVFSRLLDGVDPAVADEVREVVAQTKGVLEVTEVRVRWSGHRLLAEANLAVSPESTVGAAHEVVKEAEHRLLHNLRYLSKAIIHIDPFGSSGEEHHQLPEHIEGTLPTHTH